MDCTIIICSRNRAAILEKTLKAFAMVKVPPGLSVEMIIADNGSTDHTADVVSAACHPAIEIRYVCERKPGKSHAMNTSIAMARGEALLFTDDDVVPAENWIEKMSKPLLEKHCEAVAGSVILAETLRRDWFAPMHEVWLACIGEPADCSPELIGASMGIHRSVFDTIIGFDEELGPGASGYGEETLLWRQMQEARMRILPVRDTHVVHYPDEDRLLRSSWHAAALSLGRGEAYVRHHWFHHRVWFPRVRLNWLRLKLRLRGLFRVAPRAEAEGCDAWEMTYWYRIEALKCSMREERRPRNYECRGLIKRAHV